MIVGSALDAEALFVSLKDEAHVEWERLRLFSEYYQGKHRLPYTPKRITPEFEALALRSRSNLIPNVVSTQVDRLYVDGFRPDTADDPLESPAWGWWQANGLDSRQTQLFSSVAKYGYGFMYVWPGVDGTPVLKPMSARTWFAKFDTYDDDFASVAIRVNGDTGFLLDGMRMFTLSRERSASRESWTVIREDVHGLGVVPLVTFYNAWPDEDEPPSGEIEPLIDVQDRLNQTAFDLLVTQTFHGAPQQWVAGIVADADDKVKAMAKRVWTFDEPGTSVGQLPPADLTQLIAAVDNTIRLFGIKSRTPPNYLLGEMVNISAEALVAAHADLDAKIANRQQLAGESFERMFRLAGVAAGDQQVVDDDRSQVVWRQTDPRSLASTVDALGKMAQMLHVPVEELWAMVPGVTQQDVARWQAKYDAGDPFTELRADFDRVIEGMNVDG